MVGVRRSCCLSKWKWLSLDAERNNFLICAASALRSFSDEPQCWISVFAQPRCYDLLLEVCILVFLEWNEVYKNEHSVDHSASIYAFIIIPNSSIILQSQSTQFQINHNACPRSHNSFPAGHQCSCQRHCSTKWQQGLQRPRRLLQHLQRCQLPLRRSNLQERNHNQAISKLGNPSKLPRWLRSLFVLPFHTPIYSLALSIS